jgi:hypothetical protein
MTMTGSLSVRIVDPLACARMAEKVADRYISRDGTERHEQQADVAEQTTGERQMLEFAFERVRRGLGNSALGKAARRELDKIEAVMERDYGLYSRIRPVND